MSSVRIHFPLVQDEDGYPPVAVETVWASPTVSPHEYLIDNVPFFARDATIGDVVRVREEDGQHWFDGVVHRSTNSLVRVVFFDQESVERISTALVALGCSIERLKEHSLMAVSVPRSTKLTEVQTYLQLETDAGAIDYEEPLLR